MTKDEFLSHIKRAEKAKNSRGNWENTWQVIREFVRPTSEDFNSLTFDGEVLSNKILDDTAIRGAEDLGSLLVSSLVPDTSRWFNLTIADKDLIEDDHDVKLWLEEVSDIIYKVYTLPTVNHGQQIHEDIFDIISFGSGVLYQDWDPVLLRPTFKTFPLADCVWFEDWNGSVDTMYRWVDMSTRQVIQRFGKNGRIPSKIRDEKDPDKIWKFMHLVYPRSDRNQYSALPTNMKFASCWACLDDKENGPVEESGFREFPYHVARWAKRTGEVYGRSPAWNCLASILMLNKMEETTLVGAMKIVDPVLMMPDDGFINTPKTFPGAINIYEAGTQDRIEALETKGRPDIGIDMCDRRRQMISRAFYTDLVELGKKDHEMTAYESQVRNGDRFRMMGPMLGRLMKELLAPKLGRTYNLLNYAGWFRPAPPQLRKHKLIPEFTSPAAKAQSQGKAMAIDQLMQSAAVIVNVRPEVMDHFDLDMAMKIKADVLGVPEKVIRSDADVADIRQRRQKEEQMQQMLAAAPQVSQSIKNIQTGQAAVTSANK